MTETIFGYPVVEMHAAAGNYDSAFQGVQIIIVHDEEASTAMSAVGRFQQAGQQASTTYVLDHSNKRFIRCTAENEVAYGCGNYYWNQRCIQFEMPGFAGQPYDPTVIDMATKLIAYAAAKYDIPLVKLGQGQVVPGAKGVTGHQFIPDPNNPNLYGGLDHHNDPGSTFPWDSVLANAAALNAGGQPQPAAPAPSVRIDPVTNHTLAGGFRAFFERLETQVGAEEALMLIGRPLTDEVQENGATVQYFERAVFEWQPGSRPADFDVLLRRLGADALAAKQAS